MIVSGVALATGHPFERAMRRSVRLAAWPIAAILGWFLVLSRVTVGAWFVTGGFYVADNPDYQPASSRSARCGGRCAKLNGTGRSRSASPGWR